MDLINSEYSTFAILNSERNEKLSDETFDAKYKCYSDRVLLITVNTKRRYFLYHYLTLSITFAMYENMSQMHHFSELIVISCDAMATHGAILCSWIPM